MNVRLASVYFSLLVLACCASSSCAQNGTSTGGNGGFGSGSNLPTTIGTGSSLGTTGTSGTSSLTGSTASKTGAAGTTGANSKGTAAQSFVGGNASQNFVGGARQATNQQQNNRQMQQFQTQQQGNTQTQSTGTPRAIRTSMTIGFSFPTASASQLSGRLANANSLSLGRFTSTKPEFANVNVSLNSNGVAVLTGSSPTTEASRLAANLVRIQPGVRKVDNQLTVAAE